MAAQTHSDLKFRNALFSNVFPQFHYRPELSAGVQNYQTRNGSTVDLVFKGKNTTIAYIVEQEEKVSASALNAATRFLKKHPNSSIFIGHQGKQFMQVNENIYSVPLKSLF